MVVADVNAAPRIFVIYSLLMSFRFALIDMLSCHRRTMMAPISSTRQNAHRATTPVKCRSPARRSPPLSAETKLCLPATPRHHSMRWRAVVASGAQTLHLPEARRRAADNAGASIKRASRLPKIVRPDGMRDDAISSKSEPRRSTSFHSMRNSEKVSSYGICHMLKALGAIASRDEIFIKAFALV